MRLHFTCANIGQVTGAALHPFWLKVQSGTCCKGWSSCCLPRDPQGKCSRSWAQGELSSGKPIARLDVCHLLWEYSGSDSRDVMESCMKQPSSQLVLESSHRQKYFLKPGGVVERDNSKKSTHGIAYVQLGWTKRYERDRVTQRLLRSKKPTTHILEVG